MPLRLVLLEDMMKFSNVGFIDDSIGGISILNSIESKFNENYIVISDNKNFPYSIRNWKVKEMSLKLQSAVEKRYIKLLVSTNPAISLNLNREVDYEIIDGIDEMMHLIKEENFKSKVILSNKYVLNYLKGEDIENVLDSQILINSIHDGDLNTYITSTLIREYVEDNEVVFIMDTNLSVLKDRFLELYPNVKFFFLSDFILRQLEKKLVKRLVEGDENKIGCFVTDYRIGFYSVCRNLFGIDDIRMRKIKL